MSTLLIRLILIRLMHMNETNLSPRQNYILTLVNQYSGIGRLEIEEKISNQYPSSKPTIARDLSYLVGKKLIKVSGNGKNTVYLPFVSNPLLRYIDLNQYFVLDPDQRQNVHKSFDLDVLKNLNNLFSEKEITEIERVNKSFTRETNKLGEDIYRKELERFIIELSWKSSKIEGNTYSLLDTETLIKQSIEAKGHSKEEAVMILNHKTAFETTLAHRTDFDKITLSQITQLHNVLVKDLSISTGVRKEAVGITGTIYNPLDNEWQIREALDKAIAIINATTYPLEKALISSALISYIQPFSDGNKRTGRMLANAILMAQDYYPLSYRSVDETTYKKALVLFYEQHSIVHLKKILVEQYLFALNTYFK